MSIGMILLILLFLLGAGLFVANLRTNFLVRKTGKRVIAEVIVVRCWQEPSNSWASMSVGTVMPLMPSWQYEIVAQWKEPGTGDSYVISSGRRKGLPGCRRGDHLSAYVSPYGNYLVLL